MKRRADDGGKLGTLGNGEVDVKALVERQESVADGLNGGQVARENNIAQAVIAGGEVGDHADGLGHKVGAEVRRTVQR